MNKFRINHVCLYAKGFYKRTNIINDVRKCLSADGYMGELMDPQDVVNIVIDNCQRITGQRAFYDFREFAYGISDKGSFRYGYYTKTNWPECLHKNELVDYNYEEAILYYCMSNIRLLSFTEIGLEKLIEPDYENCIDPPEDMTEETLKRFFPNSEIKTKSVAHA